MATLTISSGIYIGAWQPNEGINQGWFDPSPLTQFTQFSLTSANSGIKQGPQAIVGHADLFDEPVAFEFERRTRDTLTSALAAVAVKNLMNGRTRTTLSGFRDAAVVAGYLARFQWHERRNAQGDAGQAFDIWGICQVVQPSVRGAQERMTLLVRPCDALWWVGTGTVMVTPAAYAALDPGAS